MISYYSFSRDLYDYLIADNDVNTVLIGGFDEIDTNKQTMFPLAHILVGSVAPLGGVNRFSVTVSVMDVLDLNNANSDKFNWKGQDNKQQMLNTMLAVCENLIREIDKGSFQDNGYELIGEPNAEPFEDRFENLLTGWSLTFTIDVPNTIQNCYTPQGIFDNTFDNTFE